MNEQDARAAVHAAIGQVAPDVDTEDLVETSRLRQDLELDSLDFLRLIETISQATGVDVPERDYTQVSTVKGLVEYVAAHGWNAPCRLRPQLPPLPGEARRGEVHSSTGAASPELSTENAADRPFVGRNVGGSAET
ncbi:acyl carrier protein [Cryobacterium sp. TMT1-2-1]|nr:acyl carrier protein [Cryobacterium sp. TMT1-2-1]